MGRLIEWHPARREADVLAVLGIEAAQEDARRDGVAFEVRRVHTWRRREQVGGRRVRSRAQRATIDAKVPRAAAWGAFESTTRTSGSEARAGNAAVVLRAPAGEGVTTRSSGGGAGGSK